MNLRHLLAALLLATPAAAIVTPAHAQTAAEGVTIRVSGWGGKSTQTFLKYAGSIYTNKTGNKVQFIDGNSSDHVAKLVAARGRNVPYDVVLLDQDSRAGAIAAGVLEKFTEEQVPNAKYVFDEVKNRDGYGHDVAFVSTALVYNAQKFKEAGIPEPTSWRDLWDPRLANRVAIPELANANGRGFLIQTARQLGDNEGQLDGAIAEIAKLKARTYYSTSQQLESLLKSGEVWAAPMADGRVYSIVETQRDLKGVRPKEGSVSYNTTVDLVKGSPHQKEALAFINEIYGPLMQLGNAIDFFYGGTNRLIAPIIEADPTLASKLIYTVEQANTLYRPDWAVYWAAHDRAVDLWNRNVTSR